MAARGVLLGLDRALRDEVLALGEKDRIDFLEVTLWERPGFDADRYTQLMDKSWDGLHRCLAEFPPDTPYFYEAEWEDDGAWAAPEKFGSYPLKLAILGGKRLFAPDHDYFVRLVEANEVSDLAVALQKLDRDEIARRYWHHCKGAWPEYGEEDMLYTWEYFEYMRDFYKAMAEEGRCVIFLADQ